MNFGAGVITSRRLPPTRETDCLMRLTQIKTGHRMVIGWALLRVHVVNMLVPQETAQYERT